VQTPLTHWSLVVQTFPSSHDVPSGLKPFAGQAVDVPLQVSATSQNPLAERQTVPADATVSAGHALLDPSQLSATSHAPAAERQTAVLFWSFGQLAPDPVQFSARSQTPADARHWVVAGLKASAGQAAFTPSQLSA
jgi:hypothetical protein